MCGIAGGYGFNAINIVDTLACLAHRGPDDSGFFVDKNNDITLLHTRLAIQDLSSAGHQPFSSSDGLVTIVFNGEIYNVISLRKELLVGGYTFSSKSDTEVIINLYLRYGVNLLDKLNGIFAFAIWDKRINELFLARDGLGVKPLYYTQPRKSFLFSSEIKSLLLDTRVSRQVNYRSAAYHLTYLWSPSPETILDGIYKLEPGHAMIINNGRTKRKWRFYDIPYSEGIQSISKQEALEETRRLVSQAVKRQLIADVPVGAFLSGGLDSSACVAFARQHMPNQEIQAYSIDLKGKGIKSEGVADDLPYARKVAEYLGVNLNIVTVGSEIIRDLERMIYYLDEPQADPAPLNALYISRLAREQGIKVLLSGAGGDDIFTGYRRHYALLQERYWSWLPMFFRERISGAIRLTPSTYSTSRRVVKALQYANLEGNRRIASYFFWLNPEMVHEVLSQKAKCGLSASDVATPLLATLENVPQTLHPVNKLLYLEAKHFLADHNLNYTDKMGMAEGVEVRVPLLDLDLVAFAASLPVHYKQRGRIGKWILKKAMEGILPNDVIYRSKAGFGAPLRFWLRNELKEMVDDVLSQKSIGNRGLFDYAGVNRLRKLDSAGKLDAAYPIFSMICMELWCRMFIDSPIQNRQW